MQYLPASSQCIDKLTKAQAADPVCSTLIPYCENGWPDKHLLRTELKPYWKWKGQLATHNNLLLYGTCIVIRLSMQQEILGNSMKAIRVSKGAIYVPYTINRERFAGINFCVFCSFQEYHESFSMNIIQASCNGTCCLSIKYFKHKAPQKFSREKLHWVESAIFSPANLSPFTVISIW